MFAFGNKHSYHEVIISTSIKCKSPINLAVHDHRRYVCDGTKSASYIGSMRSGVGIPYDILTKSEKPLAEEMQMIIKSALEKNGNRITSFSTNFIKTDSEILNEMYKNQHSFNLYIDIREWKTDTYIKADLYCLMTLYIYNASGTLLAETTVKANREAYGGSFWNPKKAARKGALKAVKLKLEALINDEVVLRTLES